MPRIHTRHARKLRMFRSRKTRTKKKPKTFKTEIAAKKFAESKGIKNYKLVDISPFNQKKNKIKIILD